MTRSAKLALIISGAVLACVLACCGVALALRDWVPGLAGCEDVSGPTKTHVITEKVRIEQLWPQLAPVRSVHWQEREARARSCPEIGPMDYIMEGFAVLTPEVAAALPATQPATLPAVPDDLRPFIPPAPTWLRVADTQLVLDRASATVYFTRTTT